MMKSFLFSNKNAVQSSAIHTLSDLSSSHQDSSNSLPNNDSKISHYAATASVAGLAFIGVFFITGGVGSIILALGAAVIGGLLTNKAIQTYTSKPTLKEDPIVDSKEAISSVSTDIQPTKGKEITPETLASKPLELDSLAKIKKGPIDDKITSSMPFPLDETSLMKESTAPLPDFSAPPLPKKEDLRHDSKQAASDALKASETTPLPSMPPGIHSEKSKSDDLAREGPSSYPKTLPTANKPPELSSISPGGL